MSLHDHGNEDVENSQYGTDENQQLNVIKDPETLTPDKSEVQEQKTYLFKALYDVGFNVAQEFIKAGPANNSKNDQNSFPEPVSAVPKNGGQNTTVTVPINTSSDENTANDSAYKESDNTLSVLTNDKLDPPSFNFDKLQNLDSQDSETSQSLIIDLQEPLHSSQGSFICDSDSVKTKSSHKDHVVSKGTSKSEPNGIGEDKSVVSESDTGEKETDNKSFLRRGKPVVAQAREIAANVCEFFFQESQGNIKIPVGNWMQRAAAATGCSKSVLQRSRKEKTNSGTFKTPGEKRKPRDHAVSE